jgi:hypothetical protein
MTVDVAWAEPAPFTGGPEAPRCPAGSKAWAVDYKSGDPVFTSGVERNLQTDAAALLIARWTGAAEVVPAIIYIRKGDGLWDVPATALGPAQLDAIEATIRETVARVHEQDQRQSDELFLEGYVESEHCTYCPAATRCPAKTATLQALLGGDVLCEDAELGEVRIRKLLVLAPQLEAMSRRIKDAAKAHVLATGAPIALDSGKLWGPNPNVTKFIEPLAGFRLLEEEVGTELARKALKLSLSREAIKSAAKAHLEAIGSEDSAEGVVRRIFARAIDGKVLLEKTETWWSAYAGAPVAVPALPPVAAPEPGAETAAPTKRRKAATKRAPEAIQTPPELPGAPEPVRAAPEPAPMPEPESTRTAALPAVPIPPPSPKGFGKSPKVWSPGA